MKSQVDLGIRVSTYLSFFWSNLEFNSFNNHQTTSLLKANWTNLDQLSTTKPFSSILDNESTTSSGCPRLSPRHQRVKWARPDRGPHLPWTCRLHPGRRHVAATWSFQCDGKIWSSVAIGNPLEISRGWSEVSEVSYLGAPLHHPSHGWPSYLALNQAWWLWSPMTLETSKWHVDVEKNIKGYTLGWQYFPFLWDILCWSQQIGKINYWLNIT